MTLKYDEKVKILMLGESGVGKSSLLMRFSDNKFSTNYVVTLGVEFKQRVLEINGKQVLVQVWDTAGQEQFRTITPVYYKNVDGVVLVYDITDENSFDSVNFWMENLATYGHENITVVLVGNKADLNDKRGISKEKGKELADKYNLDWEEASAKSSFNVNEIFNSLATEILNKKSQGIVARNPETNGSQQLLPPKNNLNKQNQEGNNNNNKNKKDGGCCN